MDRTCKLCGLGDESIFHALFTCSSAANTWLATRLPLPPRGLSRTSVFLNIHHLMACSKSKECPEQLKRDFPWIFWNIWKARNALVFEKVRWDPASILLKAEEESKSWYEANALVESKPPEPSKEDQLNGDKWSAPTDGIRNCNIGVAWSAHNHRSGASWVVRDSRGKVLMHSCRSFSAVRNLEMAELWAIFWAVDCM